MYSSYTPATRLLATLELLQSHTGVTAGRLAEHLEVNSRSARRYISMLQSMGIPVKAERGRYGGYRLQPGYRMPPLMLSDEEATAVTLGLMAAQRLGLAGSIPAVEGALSKVERVLPASLRERVQAIRATVALDFPPVDTPVVSPAIRHLHAFSMAARLRRSVRMSYQSGGKGPTERDFDSYGLVHYQEHWYVVGHCHLRDDIRIFRLDRVLAVSLQGAIFAGPEEFDCLAYAIARFAAIPDNWLVEVLLEMPPDVLRSSVPPTFATLEEVEGGTLLRAFDRDLDHSARFLIGLGVRFHIRQPAELRESLRRLAKDILLIAGEQGG